MCSDTKKYLQSQGYICVGKTCAFSKKGDLKKLQCWYFKVKLFRDRGNIDWIIEKIELECEWAYKKN
jgi:hypothetical protein